MEIKLENKIALGRCTMQALTSDVGVLPSGYYKNRYQGRYSEANRSASPIALRTVTTLNLAGFSWTMPQVTTTRLQTLVWKPITRKSKCKVWFVRRCPIFTRHSVFFFLNHSWLSSLRIMVLHYDINLKPLAIAIIFEIMRTSSQMGAAFNIEYLSWVDVHNIWHVIPVLVLCASL